MYDRTKMLKLYKKEEVDERITVTRKGGANVDVHGMDRNRARMFVKNVLILHEGLTYVRVIHGHNKGTVLQRMVRKTFRSHPTVRDMDTPAYNPGETVFYLKTA